MTDIEKNVIDYSEWDPAERNFGVPEIGVLTIGELEELDNAFQGVKVTYPDFFSNDLKGHKEDIEKYLNESDSDKFQRRIKFYRHTQISEKNFSENCPIMKTFITLLEGFGEKIPKLPEKVETASENVVAQVEKIHK